MTPGDANCESLKGVIRNQCTVLGHRSISGEFLIVLVLGLPVCFREGGRHGDRKPFVRQAFKSKPPDTAVCKLISRDNAKTKQPNNKEMGTSAVI